jgi:hypothetical protein
VHLVGSRYTDISRCTVTKILKNGGGSYALLRVIIIIIINIINIIMIIIIITTAIECALGGSSPYTSTDKTK